MSENKAEYKIGDHIATENGKMTIANDKKTIIAHAEREIKEYQAVHDEVTKELIKWKIFLNKVKESK